MGSKDIDYSNWQLVKDLWHFLKFRKWRFIFFSVVLLIAFSTSLVTPVILAMIIDFFVSGGKDIGVFYSYLWILLGVGMVGNFMRQYGKYNLNLYSSEAERHAKIESFDKILQGDLVWHEGISTGEKMQKVNDGINMIRAFMDFYINNGIRLVVSIVGVISVFFYFNIKYALIAVVFIVVYLFAEFKLNKSLAKNSLIVKKARELASGKAYEFSSNISTIKSLGIEKSSGEKIVNVEDSVLRAQSARKKASAIKWNVLNFIVLISLTLFIFLVGNDILIGVLTVGAIVIYVQYFNKLREGLSTISVQINRLIDIKFGIFRMMGIYRMIPDIDESGAGNLKKWKHIRVKDLSFKYKSDFILDNLNLDIRKGEKIGIVGMSGSGKSTLFKLLLKLHLAKKGEICFDDKSIEKIKRDSILKKISVVPQETELFNLTLRDNITISGGRFNLARYKKALEISQVSSYLSKLKNRDLTFIGEKGVRLSGGERQRLGIARAIYKNSDVIIFDESTSNLDYVNEGKILGAIDKKLKNKTLIVAAHRLTTLESMDRILFIEKGRVVEEGSYDELLKMRGKFYRLWKSQGRK
ncbi:ABC transporter ATP-binding protein [archaeon]|nr:ABC transporter ATP-binding protein [archaeon]